jgi:hypothetical protein
MSKSLLSVTFLKSRLQGINPVKLSGLHITLTSDEKVSSSLDECLLDEDIGGFVGSYLFDDIGLIKESDEVMKAIFGHEENLCMGETVLLANWDNWNAGD